MSLRDYLDPEYSTAAHYASHEAATELRYGLEPRRIGGQAYDPADVPSPSDLRDEL